MNAVRWLSLELSGFGVYDEMKAELPADLAVLIAANESGKSTLVAGLTAVVFGLPTSNDPTGWGTGKYRSYSSNARYAGRVEFLARDGKRYEVRRDFESHDVNLTCLEPGPRRTLFTGKHNPGARKATGKYEDLLGDLVGLTSAELFRQTFSIEQPLRSAAGLSDDVAELLAGAGGGSHLAALGYLATQVEERTRYTGDLGLSARNKNKDRELEELESRIASIEEQMLSGRAAADGLQKIQLALADLQGQLDALKLDEEKLVAKERSAREWLEAQAAFARAQRQLSELQGRFEKARAESLRLDQLKRPSAEESRELEREWSFAEGSAVAYLRSRRHDADEALEEYRLFRESASAASEARKDLDEYRSLEVAPPDLLVDLRSFDRIEQRLENDVESARQHLEEIERQRLANDPARSFEDVAGLSEEEVERLRSGARQPRTAIVLGSLIGVAAAVAAGLSFDATLPVLVVIALGALVLGAACAPLPGRAARRAAKGRLERFEEWRRRSETAHLPDLEPYELRVTDAKAELDEFRERLGPFREEFVDLAASIARFDELRSSLAESEAAAARYARDHWAVSTSEVESADPNAAGGCWARTAALLTGIGRDTTTVAQVVGALEGLDWDELEADARAWDAVARARTKREQELERTEAILSSLLDADEVDGLDEFREKVMVKQTDALAERNAFKEICELNPELPRFDDPNERRSEVADLQRRYASDLQKLDTRTKELEGRIQELLRERAEKQGQNPVNIAALELELETLREERDELRFEVRAYALAYTTLEEASREYQDEYLERLADLATDYFREFTGGPGRQVTFRDGFTVRVVEEGGVELDPQRLSQGAQDQLALALHLAIADMISGDVHLPLVFDDPFQNCDAERLLRIREALTRIALERQVILLSHEERYASWGAQLSVTRSRGVGVQDSLLLAGED